MIISGVWEGKNGYRESTDTWYELLPDLRCRGLDTGPRLAVGDGTIGFKLVQSAEKRWKRIKDFNLIGEVITGVVCKDRLRVLDQSDGRAA